MDVTPELVLAMWAVGMEAVLVVVQSWRVVSPGYGWLVGTSAAFLGLFAWAAASPKHPGILAFAALAFVAVVIGAIRPLRRVAWPVAEALAAIAGIVALVPIGADSIQPAWTGVLRALSGAACLGAITDAMIFGHWYLIDPKLPKLAIARLNRLAGLMVVIEAVVVLLPPSSVLGAIGEGQGLSVLAWFVLGAFTGILVFLVSRALREPGYASVMSATGLFYVATMVGFGFVIVSRLA